MHRSNRLDALVDAYVDVVRARPLAPLDREVVVASSAVHATWLANRLADRLGSWVNPHFPFLQSFVEELAATVLGPAPVDRYRVDALAYWVAARLPHFLNDPQFDGPAQYLGAEIDPHRLLGIGRALAETFDRQSVYRPLANSTEPVAAQGIPPRFAGAGTDWQDLLWRDVVAAAGAFHPAARIRALIPRLEPASASLPPRVTLFGASDLPPLHLELFSALGRHTEVHLLLLTPTREYIAESQRSDGDLPPLLGSSGRRAREMQALLETRTVYVDAPRDRFVTPAPTTLLGALAFDLLNAQRRAPADRLVLAASDRSIEVHVCHSPLRAVEVLADQLRGAFADDNTLRPADIAILTPDLPTYAPLLGAVLGEADLPVLVVGAGAQLGAPAPEIEACTQVLALLGGDVPANQVLALLESPAVQKRLELGESNLPLLRRWFEDGPVRWGIDAQHRRRRSRRAQPQGTFRFAIDRWLAGTMVTARSAELPVAPLPLNSGAAATLLGRVCEYLEELFALCELAESSRSMAAWIDALLIALPRLAGISNNHSEPMLRVRQALMHERQSSLAASFDMPLPFAVVNDRLMPLIEAAGRVTGQARDAILAGDPTELRALPHRLIVMLGYDDGAVPRSEPRRSFDRLAIAPQLGDPSRRDDDRAAFLDALAAARQRVLVLYCGRDLHDDSERPPAVVVEELLDAVTETATWPAGKIIEHITIRHALHGHARRYFDLEGDARVASFATAAREAASPNPGRRARPAPIFAEPLSPVTPPWLSIGELADLLSNPVRALATRRLGINLRERDERLVEHEPLWLVGLDEYAVKSRLLDERLNGATFDAAFETLVQTGLLRPGHVASVELARVRPQIDELLDAIAMHGVTPASPFDVDLQLGGHRLVDKILDYRDTGFYRYRIGRVRAKDELPLWLAHLAIAAQGSSDHPSHYFGTDGRTRFRAVSSARAQALLTDYLAIAVMALRQPLRLLPEASSMYAQAIRRGDTIPEALDAARKASEAGYELRDPFLELCFGRSPPWDQSAPFIEAGEENQPTFASLSERVWSPLWEFRDE